MKIATPSYEAERLEALRNYYVLDTAPEQAYDELTALAAHICRVPVALISLVDEYRQWFKARVGLHRSQTSRDVAFCAHAILRREPLVVRDALKDKRFADSSLVTGKPHIRFYAGIPLLNSEGMPLGTLCVIDRQPRRLTSAQHWALQALARQAMALLELRRASSHLAQVLQQVKTLQGLLPICAWCKRIRDDRGYWNQVENYLHERTGADFTHCICPQCLDKQLPKAS
jgi:GAF domain-containing protein